MSRIAAVLSVVLLAVTMLSAAGATSAPDFWYVVSDATQAAAKNRVVRGIVIPSSVKPTVRTKPEGSIVSWMRPDGTRQSVVVRGISSFTFEPGPLKGTTFVPFVEVKRLQHDPMGCCICASWRNMSESFEHMTCEPGCDGCGCEACICPSLPCPDGARAGMTLVAHNDPTTVMTLGKSGTADEIAIVHGGNAAVRFHGRHLSADVDSSGQTEINNPESISIPGKAVSRETLRGDRAVFAWSSPQASVIIEQPRTFTAPSFRDGTIELAPRPSDAPTTTSTRLAVDPLAARCQVCGTHPNSWADVDLMECTPGNGTCYRCISWECFAPAL